MLSDLLTHAGAEVDWGRKIKIRNRHGAWFRNHELRKLRADIIDCNGVRLHIEAQFSSDTYLERQYGCASKGGHGCDQVSTGCLAYALDNFEVPFKLPIGHRILKLAPFPFPRGGEVIDKRIAEKFPC